METRRGGRKRRLTNKAQAALDHGSDIPGIFYSPPSQRSITPPLLVRSTELASSDTKTPPLIQRHVPGGTMIPAFGKEDFLIDDWEAIEPQNCTKVSGRSTPSRKDPIDAKQNSKFVRAADADDWCEFPGDASLYGSGNAREYAIARTFVSRARNARRLGKTWEKFEEEEDTFDTMAATNAEMDPLKQRAMKLAGLDNDLRLAIFDRIKFRLCNEIWLEEYPLQDAYSGKGNFGLLGEAIRYDSEETENSRSTGEREADDSIAENDGTT